MTALLDVKNLGHAFGGFHVLKDVNFDVPEGQIVGLIGPNGSGKTTIFNIVSGFLRQKQGEVVLSGTTINPLTVQERSAQGMIRTFQTPKVFEHMTVLENVMTGAHLHSRSGFLASAFRSRASLREAAAVQEAALAACARFGITGLVERLAGSLPGGQKRLVELARAWLARPRLLMLDEQSSGLSTDEIGDLRARIRDLADEGITVLLVSHDMGLMSVCDRVHVLYYGQIIASGGMAEIQSDPRVRDAYLGG